MCSIASPTPTPYLHKAASDKEAEEDDDNTDAVLATAVESEFGRTTDPVRMYTVSYTHLRAHETPEHLVCRLLLEK